MLFHGTVYKGALGGVRPQEEIFSFIAWVPSIRKMCRLKRVYLASATSTKSADRQLTDDKTT
jgi:hypothetical protein